MARNSVDKDGRVIIAAERRRIILDRIRTNGSVSVSDLAQELNVGVTTIRQDLNALDKQGKLIRSHGGAMASDTARPSLPYSQTRGERIEEKSRIAAAALQFIPDTGRFFIGPGTTALQFARRLPEGHDFRVATNSLEVALELASRRIATVDFFGGTVRADSLSVDITMPNSDLDDMFWDVGFLGAAAVDVTRGITTLDKTAMLWERKIFEQSGKRVVLCDSSKIGTFSYVKVCPISAIDILITDSGIDPTSIEEFKEHGVRLVIAGTEKTVIVEG